MHCFLYHSIVCLTFAPYLLFHSDGLSIALFVCSFAPFFPPYSALLFIIFTIFSYILHRILNLPFHGFCLCLSLSLSRALSLFLSLSVSLFNPFCLSISFLNRFISLSLSLSLSFSLSYSLALYYFWLFSSSNILYLILFPPLSLSLSCEYCLFFLYKYHFELSTKCAKPTLSHVWNTLPLPKKLTANKVLQKL